MAHTPDGRSKKRTYHHGDLERALVDTAVRMIQDEGVAGADPARRRGPARRLPHRALPPLRRQAGAARPGRLRGVQALSRRAGRGGGARRGSGAPIRCRRWPPPTRSFARANPSHYQTMFSGVLTNGPAYPELALHGEAAFNVLLDAIRRGQERGRIGAGRSDRAGRDHLGDEPRHRHARDGASALAHPTALDDLAVAGLDDPGARARRK